MLRSGFRLAAEMEGGHIGYELSPENGTSRIDANGFGHYEEGAVIRHDTFSAAAMRLVKK